MNRGDGAGTRSGAGRLRFPSATLKDTNVDIFFVSNAYELNVHAALEVRMVPDFRPQALPVRREVIDDDHELRITHGEWNSGDDSLGQLKGGGLADLGLPHIHLKFKLLARSGGESANLDASTGANGYNAPTSLRDEIRGDAAGAIAREFGLGSIGIDQTDASVDLRIGVNDLHAVGADNEMSIANSMRKRSDIFGNMPGIDENEIVAAGLSFDEGYGHARVLT